jgi:hypothetical protein
MMMKLHVLSSGEPIAVNTASIVKVGKSFSGSGGAFISTMDGGTVEVSETYEQVLERIPRE